MTTTQALLITLGLAFLTSITGADIVNNTTFLIVLLIALVALARSTTRNFCCRNRFNNQSLALI